MRAPTVGRKMAELRIGKVLREITLNAVERYALTGDATVVEPNADRFAMVMLETWRRAIRSQGLTVVRELKGCYPQFETKADEGYLWEEILRAYINQYGGRAITYILETTRQQIMDAVQKGLSEGKPLDAIVKSLREKVPQLSRYRAHVIARTETHSASMYAGVEVAKRSRFALNKVWKSVLTDTRTRDFGESDGDVDAYNHRIMNDVSVSLDEPFMVPTKQGATEPLMFPGDPNGSAGNVINCRCNVSYKRAGSLFSQLGAAA